MNGTPQSESEVDRCVGLAEAGRILGVCVRTVTREIQRGRLRAFRVGRKWKIQTRDLRRYMDGIAIRGLKHECV
jgi:excisionase family DNA binding protein